MRSVRKTDQSIVWPIGGIFAYSGGAAYAIASIDTAPVKQLDETPCRFADVPGRRHRVPKPDAVPGSAVQPVGEGRPDVQGAGSQSDPAAAAVLVPQGGREGRRDSAVAVVVNFAAGYAITWNWDSKSGTWLRSKFGGPDTTADGVRLAPKNVVVMFVQYFGGAGVEQSEANLSGSGQLLVFTDGKEIKGTWSRPDKSKPARLLNSTGGAIRLTPGQTWVELPDISYPVNVLP